AVVDNAVNRRAREFLQVIEKMSGEADVIKARERSCEEECEGLRFKCEAAMAEFDQNPVVLAIREKISSLTIDVKEHKGNLDRMMLKSQKWVGYQVTLSTLESKVNSLEANKARLEVVEVSLRREVEELKQDRRDVVSKAAYEQVAAMKEPFDLSKVKDIVLHAAAPIEALLSKKPPTLQKPAPSRTQIHAPSSQKATPSFASFVNPISPHAGLLKLSPTPLE
ncbi:hypothetical protein Tco_1269458, partial [Tanacetum coccineum]